MYKHILIPTDGSELSKMALEEGVALAKALGARVTVVTVTTPFHVLTVSPGMLTDTPERYKEHMTAFASQYLDVAKKIAAAAGVACDVEHIEHEHPKDLVGYVNVAAFGIARHRHRHRTLRSSKPTGSHER